jgi:hypothetical protein
MEPALLHRISSIRFVLIVTESRSSDFWRPPPRRGKIEADPTCPEACDDQVHRMALAFSCPSCGGSRKVRDEFAGKRIRCPECEAVILVPSSAKARRPKPAPAPAAPETAITETPAPTPVSPPAGSRLVRALAFVASAFGFFVVGAMLLSGFYPDLFGRQGPAADYAPLRIEIKNKRFSETGAIQPGDRLPKPLPTLGKVRQLHMRKGTCYLIGVRSDNLDPRLLVLDAADGIVAEKKVDAIPHQAFEYFLPETDGDYRIVVTSASGTRVGDYVLDISISEARSLPTEVVAGSVGPTDEIDEPRPMLGKVIRRTLKQGKEYTFKTEGKGFKSHTYLLDADTKLILRETSHQLPDGLLFLRPIADGEYEIVVSSANGKETGDFVVSIREWDAEPSNRAPPVARTTEEPPLQTGRVTPIQLDEGRFESTGKIDPNAGVEFLPNVVGKTFELELLKGRGYRIDLKCPGRFGNIIILTAAGKHIATSRNPGEEQLSAIEFAPKLTQRYRIIVESTEGPYTLRILQQSQATAPKKRK